MRHAEIAGGGFAAMTAAVALAQFGWSVRVHERSKEPRTIGWGITIHPNSLRVMRALGVYDAILEDEHRTAGYVTIDGRDQVMAGMMYDIPMYNIWRSKILSALNERADALGVERCYGNEVLGAEPDGVLLLGNGARLRADLVVGADGVFSKVRDSLNLLKSRVWTPDGCLYLGIPRTREDYGGRTVDPFLATELWSSKRRIGVMPTGPDRNTIYMTCNHRDLAGQKRPIDLESWMASFPRRGALLERIHTQVDWAGVNPWYRFQTIKLRAWSAGRAALVGDAASALAPNLGLGAVMAIQNAFTLAVELNGADDVATALQQWERRERPLTEHAQRWSTFQSILTTWPAGLQALAMNTTSRLGWLRRRYQLCSRHSPRGTQALQG